jgi:hypothetical protein
MLASRATLKRLGKRANVQLLINLALLEMVGAAHSLNPALASSVSTAHRRCIRGHSTPIALAPGQRFSPIRFSLTGAEPTYRIFAERLVRRAGERKTLFITTTGYSEPWLLWIVAA